jgi:ABC-type glycerol-3-phosphate transport system permease component
MTRTTLRRIRNRIGVSIVLTIIAIFVVFPYYWMFVTALSPESTFNLDASLIPRSIDISSFVDTLMNPRLWNWMRNSLVVAIVTVVFGLVISVNAAYNLSRFSGRLNSLSQYAILTTQMMPAAVLVLPFFFIFLTFGLTGSLLGLVIANVLFGLPLSVWMLKGFFDNAPRELEEAAMVDGCSRLGAFYRVILPITAPGIAAVAVFVFMFAWGEFFFARTLVGRHETEWVMTLGLTAFRGEFSVDQAGLMAAVTIYVIPALVVFLVSRRAIVKGLTSGGVKG